MVIPLRRNGARFRGCSVRLSNGYSSSGTDRQLYDPSCTRRRIQSNCHAELQRRATTICVLSLPKFGCAPQFYAGVSYRRGKDGRNHGESRAPRWFYS